MSPDRKCGRRHHSRVPHDLSPTHVGKTTRVARLPGDHSQVGWLPPSYALYHYVENDSSPLTQRKLRQTGLFPSFRGLIPARAGKTSTRYRPLGVGTAHPHAGGENKDGVIDRLSIGGSSPRGRGKLLADGRAGPCDRLIPARAGKTSAHSRMSRPSRAHPRSGGENMTKLTGFAAAPGSSPRGRGKPDVAVFLLEAVRLIPARAGKTESRGDLDACLGAHPRAGGENHIRRCSRSPAAGSSPRGRGKRTGNGIRQLVPGLIPARAGKTVTVDIPRWREEAHPRAGGENRSRRDAA